MADRDDDIDFDDADEIPLDVDDYPNLVSVARFARMLGATPWFTALGRRLTEPERDLARAYLSALGFPDAEVADIVDWEDAENAARSPEWNSDWWEVEEQLRAGLTSAALELVDEDTLTLTLTHVTARAAEVVQDAAANAAMMGGMFDEALIRAAAGAATQAAYQAALVLAAGEEEDHAFALKFRLFEAGHWPIGVSGMSFNLF